ILAALFVDLVTGQRVATIAVHKLCAEYAQNLFRAEFAFLHFGAALNRLRQFDLHPAWQCGADLLFEQISSTAFTRLAVDADHRLVIAAKVARVDWQISHIPWLVVLLLAQTLADGILMAAGEGGIHQL